MHHPPSHQSPPPPTSQLLFRVSWTFFCWPRVLGASLVAQTRKRLPAMRETLVRFLGREDPLEKEMAIHSSTLAGKSHGQRSLIGYSPWGHKESDTTELLATRLWLQTIIQNEVSRCKLLYIKWIATNSYWIARELYSISYDKPKWRIFLKENIHV